MSEKQTVPISRQIFTSPTQKVVASVEQQLDTNPNVSKRVFVKNIVQETGLPSQEVYAKLRSKPVQSAIAKRMQKAGLKFEDPYIAIKNAYSATRTIGLGTDSEKEVDDHPTRLKAADMQLIAQGDKKSSIEEQQKIFIPIQINFGHGGGYR